MDKKRLTISEAAEIIGVSVDTLRRWDANGKLPEVHSTGGHRFYTELQLQIFLSDLIKNGWEWAKNSSKISRQMYCERLPIFQARLDKLGDQLFAVPELAAVASLVYTACGEMGNNSFDHNIGNWPDVPGVYFAYDVTKRLVVLADRGRGVLATLRHVRPSLANDAEALGVAFTETISGRAPESRGNGLKLVRRIVEESSITVEFQSGSAKLYLRGDTPNLRIEPAEPIQGCFAVIRF